MNVIEELEAETLAPDFWQDSAAAQKMIGRINEQKEVVKSFAAVETEFQDVKALWDLAVEADDEQLAKEARIALEAFRPKMDSLQLALLLSGEYDNHGALLALHAGAGGVEAQDWVEMLMRMYMRYGEKNGYKTEIIDFLAGEEAGVKSVTISFEGLNAYGYLKSERGVHRLVRISPFDAASRRHTSFASVDVMPQVADDNEVKINDEDLRIDTYRSSGKGGQHLNKTDSAVRITHIPTGIVVQCQDERSQLSNKDKAMRVWMAKLLDLRARAREEELAELKGTQQDIAWGSQIRSYVFQPYRMVKDHRTNVEVGNIDAVMDGDLDAFISAYLHKFAVKK